MYLSFKEYTDMGGTMDEATFNNFAFEAEAIIDYYTFNRLKKDTVVPEQVKRLMFALLDIAEKRRKTLALGMSNTSDSSDVYITRQSNDGVDTTYNGMSAATLYQLCRTETNKAINFYLASVVNEAGRRVLYRGLYPGE